MDEYVKDSSPSQNDSFTQSMGNMNLNTNASNILLEDAAPGDRKTENVHKSDDTASGVVESPEKTNISSLTFENTSDDVAERIRTSGTPKGQNRMDIAEPSSLPSHNEMIPLGADTLVSISTFLGKESQDLQNRVQYLDPEAKSVEKAPAKSNFKCNYQQCTVTAGNTKPKEPCDICGAQFHVTCFEPATRNYWNRATCAECDLDITATKARNCYFYNKFKKCKSGPKYIFGRCEKCKQDYCYACFQKLFKKGCCNCTPLYFKRNADDEQDGKSENLTHHPNPQDKIIKENCYHCGAVTSEGEYESCTSCETRFHKQTSMCTFNYSSGLIGHDKRDCQACFEKKLREDHWFCIDERLREQDILIGTVNVRGVDGRIEKLRSLLNTLPFTVLFVQETLHDDGLVGVDSSFNRKVDGYIYIRRDLQKLMENSTDHEKLEKTDKQDQLENRENEDINTFSATEPTKNRERPKNGVGMYVKMQRYVANSIVFHSSEQIIACKIKVRQRELIAASVYTPALRLSLTLIAALKNFIEELTKKQSLIFFGGDINVNILEPAKSFTINAQRQLLSLENVPYNLKSLVDFPTHTVPATGYKESPKTGTAIDLLFASEELCNTEIKNCSLGPRIEAMHHTVLAILTVPTPTSADPEDQSEFLPELHTF